MVRSACSLVLTAVADPMNTRSHPRDCQATTSRDRRRQEGSQGSSEGGASSTAAGEEGYEGGVRERDEAAEADSGAEGRGGRCGGHPVRTSWCAQACLDQCRVVLELGSLRGRPNTCFDSLAGRGLAMHDCLLLLDLEHKQTERGVPADLRSSAIRSFRGYSETHRRPTGYATRNR